MFDTQEEILRQLENLEDSRAEFKTIEFKGARVHSPDSESMAGEMVAFANSSGGVFFLGVDDLGIVRGIPDDLALKLQEWIINIATNNCEPPLRPIIRRERLTSESGSKKLILLVEIPRGLYVHSTRSGRHYVRVGDSKQILAGNMLARLFQERGRTFVFDEQWVPGATSDDLDDESMKSFFRYGRGVIPWTDLLLNTRVLATAENKSVRPTVSGLLAFGNEPQVYMPSATISAAVYRGEKLTSNELVHSQQIDGTVDKQIDDASTFVDRFMLRPARKQKGRRDYPQFDLGVTHEAIVNAVAHRDYSQSGAKIRLFLFSDRLELYSPGALPNTITIETMPFRVFTRNQLLVRFLAEMRSRRTGDAYLESRGEGVRYILDGSEKYSGRRPVYELFDDELRLTIWSKQIDTAPAAA